jgi:hypothetical protein
MSADPIIYCLERVSDYREFERLCSAFLSGVGYPGIDPLGGTGDEGRDAIIRSNEAGKKIGFAYTVRSDWRVKLKGDCKRVHEMGHDPDVFVFVCTEALSAAEKDFAHKFVADEYRWNLDLFDIERLRVQLVGPLKHLVAQHPSIFTPPFFPQRGGESIAYSRDTILIDHVAADHALATWLARRLSLEGFRTWCHGTAPLAGENSDETVRKLLDVRANHYLPVVTNASLSDGVFLERCTIAATKEDFVLPCNTVAAPDVRIPSRLGKLVPADFRNSWKVGLGDVLERLSAVGINSSLDTDRGRQIALRDYLPTLVTVAKPEPVYANVFPLQLPKTMLIIDVRQALNDTEIFVLRKEWAFVTLTAYHLAAFMPPPQQATSVVQVTHCDDVVWSDLRDVHGKKVVNIVKELARRSLDIACLKKGMQFCNDRQVFYFPERESGEWNQRFRHVDGRSTTVQLTGERTKGWGDRASPFLYQLGAWFYPVRDDAGMWTVVLKIYVRVTTPEGVMYEGKEIGRRRKIVSKSWWNKEWLARLLGVVQALESWEGRIVVGDGERSVVMQTQPLCWQCPVGLDVQVLSGMQDIGLEIAEFRVRDDEENEQEKTLSTSEEALES